MRLSIGPTSTLQLIDGVECRLWTGFDDNGTEVHVWVRAVSPQTHDRGRLAQFDQELRALPPPVRSPSAIDMRFVF